MNPYIHSSIKNALTEQQMIDTITQIRQTPHVWKVGDLIECPAQGISLLIDLNVDDTQSYLIFLAQTGIQYELTEQNARHFIWYNTGLIYTYQNREEVQKDYNNGLFKAYFNR